MNFTKLSIETKRQLDHYLTDNPLFANYYGSELNFQNLAVWKDADSIETAEEPDRYLIVRTINLGVECYFPPVAKTWEDFEEALRWMETDSGERNIPFIVKGLTDLMADHLRLMDHGYVVTEDRDMFEYLYSSEDLRTLSGKKFHNKRNLVNQFLKQNEFVFRPYDDQDYGLVLDLLSRWEEQKLHAFEHKAILKTLDCLECYGCFADLLLVDNKVVAFAIGTKNQQMGMVLFEKADTAYTGSYAAINHLFAKKHFDDVPLINRQEDIGITELRRAKMSYNPIGFAKKYTLTRNRLTEEDVEQLRSLYHEAFDDSDSFLNFFFRQKFKPDNVIFHQEDHNIISALHFVPKTLSIQGKPVLAPFVVAAATRKSHRGKGVMHSLLRKAFLELQNQNITLCGLAPFAESFYQEMGFVTVNRTRTVSYQIPPHDGYYYESIGLDNIHLVEAIYSEKTKNAGVYVVRNDEYWRLFVAEVVADEGQIILVRDHGKPIGYYTLFSSGAEEVCFLEDEKIITVSQLNGIEMSTFGTQEPDSHTMLRIVNVKKFLSEFTYDPALTATRRLRIIDSALPSGTVTIELSVRNGQGFLREIEEFDEELTIERLTEEIFVRGSDWFPKPSIVIFDKY